MKTHQGRAGVVAVLIIALIILEALNETVFLIAVSLALIVAPAVNAKTAWDLSRQSQKDPTIASLVNKADDALNLFVGSLTGAVLGFEVIFMLRFARGVVEILIAAALLLISLPAVSWQLTKRNHWPDD